MGKCLSGAVIATGYCKLITLLSCFACRWNWNMFCHWLKILKLCFTRRLQQSVGAAYGNDIAPPTVFFTTTTTATLDYVRYTWRKSHTGELNWVYVCFVCFRGPLHNCPACFTLLNSHCYYFTESHQPGFRWPVYTAIPPFLLEEHQFRAAHRWHLARGRLERQSAL